MPTIASSELSGSSERCPPRGSGFGLPGARVRSRPSRSSSSEEGKWATRAHETPAVAWGDERRRAHQGIRSVRARRNCAGRRADEEKNRHRNAPRMSAHGSPAQPSRRPHAAASRVFMRPCPWRPSTLMARTRASGARSRQEQSSGSVDALTLAPLARVGGVAYVVVDGVEWME